MSSCCCNSSAGKEVDDDDFNGSVGFPPAAVLILAANFEGGDLRDADSPRCALLVTPFGEIFRLLATGELESFVSSCCCNSTGHKVDDDDFSGLVVFPRAVVLKLAASSDSDSDLGEDASPRCVLLVTPFGEILIFALLLSWFIFNKKLTNKVTACDFHQTPLSFCWCFIMQFNTKSFRRIRCYFYISYSCMTN